MISASNIIPSERRHNTRESNRNNMRKSSKPFRTSRRSINYAKLNDGLDPFTPPSPKRQKRMSHRPSKDGPSERRLTAHTGNGKHTRSLDLEQIMDTTLDDDNSNVEDSSENVDNNTSEKDMQIHSDLVGVTDMDGGTVEPPEPESSKPSAHEDSTKLPTTLDGGTNVQSNLTDIVSEIATPPDLQKEVSSSEQLLEDSTETSMDGVTTNSSEPPESSAPAQNAHAEITPMNIVNEISNDINEKQASPLNDHDHAQMDGVTTASVKTTSTNEQSKLIIDNDSPGPDQNSPLGGVTNNGIDSNAEIISNTEPLLQKSVSEIINNNDFPEKALLLGGVTADTNAAEQSLTLLDLVSNRTANTIEALLGKQPNKTPTERLLDTFGSPIPSELEDDPNILQSREYHTTEDEDDAIDGLLALSTQPSKPEQSEKESDLRKSGSSKKHKNPSNGKAEKRKKRSRNKKKKSNGEETKQIEKQLKEMNIAERKSRQSNKPRHSQEKSSTSKDKEKEQITKRKRRDDSSNSPGSPPGIFRLTHHKLCRKEKKEKSYKCGQCKCKAKNMEELKNHYAKKHNKAMCSVCNRTFDSDIILARHTYTHYEKRHFCKTCKEGFYFASELKKHNVSHAKTPSFQCMVAGCGKWFKRVAEVNVHMEVHKNKSWKCKYCKDFSTSCEKYLKDHYRTDHNPNGLPYGCDNCGKRFKYRMQLKRHHNDKNLCSKS